MKHSKYLASIAFFILAVNQLQAQNTLSLQEVYQEIESKNPQLKVTDATIRSMDELAKGAKNWMAPTFGTGLYMAPYNPALWKRMADGTTGMGQYMISAEQMFPNRRLQNAETDYLNAASSVEKERKTAVVSVLYNDAKENYYTWQILIKKLEILNQNEQLLRFMIKSTEIRYKNGSGKLNSYYKTKASLGSVEKMRLEIENEINQKRISLNTLMNRNKLDSLNIDTSMVIASLLKTRVDTSPSTIYRSDVKAVEQEIKLIALQQRIENAKIKPELGIRYDHMFGFGGIPMQYTLMGMVKIPLRWSTRTEKANIESLKWKAEALSLQKEVLLNEANGKASGIISQLAMKNKQLSLYETNILPALRKNFQTTQIAYEQNTEDLSVLNEAWETLNLTQLEYLDQVASYLVLQVTLDRVLERK